MFRQVGLHIANQGNNGIAEVFDQRKQDLDLGAFPAFADNDHDIILLYNTQIAVDRIAGMHENRRGAGGIKRGNDLLCDHSTFADSADHDAASAGGNGRHSAFEIFIDIGLKACNSPGFQVDGLQCDLFNGNRHKKLFANGE